MQKLMSWRRWNLMSVVDSIFEWLGFEALPVGVYLSILLEVMALAVILLVCAPSGVVYSALPLRALLTVVATTAYVALRLRGSFCLYKAAKENVMSDIFFNPEESDILEQIIDDRIKHHYKTN